MLRHVQEVIRLETQYWALVEIPKQEKQETVPAFVLRACAIMEKTQKSGEGVKTAAKIAEEEERRKERLERLSGKTTSGFVPVEFSILNECMCASLDTPTNGLVLQMD